MGWVPGRVAVGVAAMFALAAVARGDRWGEAGHEMAGRAAASKLPAEMPQFFRDAQDRLGWLTPEPDRWRADALVEANEAFRYDHYIDLEVVPEAIRSARDRFEYLSALQRTGLQRPSRDAGLLPFRIIEMQQRLTIEFANWRRATDAREREWLEHRILDDGGILGHYATDAANPHHTTIHHNGWAENAPNPNGYTTERTFHWRFENEYVSSHITFEELLAHIDGDARQFGNVRGEVWRFLLSSHAKVGELYRLEKQEMFGPGTQSGAHEAFALDRLAAGADFLRSLWWTAWLNSATL